MVSLFHTFLSRNPYHGMIRRGFQSSGKLLDLMRVVYITMSTGTNPAGIPVGRGRDWDVCLCCDTLEWYSNQGNSLSEKPV